MRPALGDLGTPGALAEQHTAGIDPEGPRYGSGAIAASATLYAIVFLLLAYAIGSGHTLAAMGGGVLEMTLWGSQIIFTSTANVNSFETANILPMLLVILAISGGLPALRPDLAAAPPITLRGERFAGGHSAAYRLCGLCRVDGGDAPRWQDVPTHRRPRAG